MMTLGSGYRTFPAPARSLDPPVDSPLPQGDHYSDIHHLGEFYLILNFTYGMAGCPLWPLASLDRSYSILSLSLTLAP